MFDKRVFKYSIESVLEVILEDMKTEQEHKNSSESTRLRFLLKHSGIRVIINNENLYLGIYKEGLISRFKKWLKNYN